jgi:predicted O-methyltransferase YrrM
MRWLSDVDLVVSGVGFHCFEDRADDQLVILKPREEIEAYQHLFTTERPRSIVELGIYGGGSVALFSLISGAEQITALDLRNGCPDLERFLSEHQPPTTVHTHYGVDQADTQVLAEIVDGPLDLIIDDASHLYEPTKASFNYLYPLLRPGGLYIIEDWGWQTLTRDRGTGPFLSELIHELLLVAARRPRMIAEVRVTHFAATVRRGDADLHAGRFDLTNHL